MTASSALQAEYLGVGPLDSHIRISTGIRLGFVPFSLLHITLCHFMFDVILHGRASTK